jgi:imidazole glycerol-phosphate synthase
MIAVIDYGAGNVGSVLRATEYLGFPAERVDAREELRRAEKIILPGQGHFGAMMRALEERQMIEPLRASLRAGKDFLGICLGLQALYERSDEAPEAAGLGLLAGRVRRLEGVFKVPHVGWSHPDRGRRAQRGCPGQLRLLLPLVLWSGDSEDVCRHGIWTAVCSRG